MSLERTNETIPRSPGRDSEPAIDVTEFLERQDEPRQRPVASRGRRTFHRKTRLAAILFVLSAISMFAAGTYLAYGLLRPIEIFIFSAGRVFPIPTRDMLIDGLVYSLCLMSILLAHEMGHFLQAVRHRVPATWPFFIPFPISPFGTMGAVIMQDARHADRRKLFDIAVSGPLAGLVLALPITWYGVATSTVEDVVASPGSVRYGDPLLLRWIVEFIHGSYGPHQDIAINAPLFAGWVGLFITGLNLLPVGQLDGGHILYTLIGKKAHYVAYGVMGLAIAWMAFSGRYEFALIVGLLFLMGPAHPPTANDRVPLGLGRTILGWLTLAFVVIGFTPTPLI